MNGADWLFPHKILDIQIVAIETHKLKYQNTYNYNFIGTRYRNSYNCNFIDTKYTNSYNCYFFDTRYTNSYN